MDDLIHDSKKWQAAGFCCNSVVGELESDPVSQF